MLVFHWYLVYIQPTFSAKKIQLFCEKTKVKRLCMMAHESNFVGDRPFESIFSFVYNSINFKLFCEKMKEKQLYMILNNLTRINAKLNFYLILLVLLEFLILVSRKIWRPNSKIFRENFWVRATFAGKKDMATTRASESLSWGLQTQPKI